MANFERLSALDATFLAIDSEQNPIHVALVAIFERAPLSDVAGKLDEHRLRAHVRTVLDRSPRLRQKLGHVPLVNHPVLVFDPDFDHQRHLRFVALSRGSTGELKDLVSRIQGAPLDRARPLWELWVIDGLEGDRVAVVMKVHQCLVADDRGAEALHLLLGPPPSTRGRFTAHSEVPALPKTIGRAEVDAYVRRVSEAAAGATSALAAWQRAGSLTRGVRYLFRSALVNASRRPRSLSPLRNSRTVEWVSVPMPQVVARATEFEVEPRELAVAALGAAMQRSVSRRGGSDGAGSQLRALVSFDSPAEQGDRFAVRTPLAVAAVPLAEEPPGARLRRTATVLRAARASSEPGALAAAETLANFTFVNFATLAARVGIRLCPFDAIVSQVAPLDEPTDLLGAKLLAYYPLLPLYLNNPITVSLVAGPDALTIGLTADGERVTDLATLTADLRTALRELGCSPDES